MFSIELTPSTVSLSLPLPPSTRPFVRVRKGTETGFEREGDRVRKGRRPETDDTIEGLCGVDGRR